MKKLLGFRQDKEVRPVGSSTSKTADVRIVALPNQAPQQKIDDGTFRGDLYYRLNVLSLVVPPLRKRRADIPVLVRQFILKTCVDLASQAWEWSGSGNRMLPKFLRTQTGARLR